ncbi:F0F1-type ATP synthase, epsilon subunit [Paracholeplasma brassicae]|jgi:F-type H+-transporting ATPase subunit epsilon|uniref:F0F1-type ATP synthase, epsilon subunit n=1 Tax=Acholeplasma brassicae TaxID=61635 RepID=U4KRI6_9MOLU|nr:F0F1-type ATP synthase epsilon subunit [Paracholeplasma brassicae]CCV65778.1 F0F1-type ATP synthase, epsilon subunit [Paracholeplasma brassicae]
MILNVYNYQGLIEKVEIDKLIVSSENGQIAILSNHLPIVQTIRHGYFQTITNNVSNYYVCYKATVEFINNEVSILAIDCQKGHTLEEAKLNSEASYQKKMLAVKEESTHNLQLERDLRENIRKAQAGNL